MYKHILVSTDGSEIAQKGVDHGLSLAKALDAKVTIITVTERPPLYPDSMGISYSTSGSLLADYSASQNEAANRILADARRAADRLGVRSEVMHVPEAQPAEAIVEAAKSQGCSLIVMASHGRRGLGRLMLGSVTAEVLAHSPLPVLVVR